MNGVKLYADSESTLAAIEERVLSCELCYERLQDPRLLACDHSFCARCCEDLAARSTGADRAMMTCPTCGAPKSAYAKQIGADAVVRWAHPDM